MDLAVTYHNRLGIGQVGIVLNNDGPWYIPTALLRVG